MMDELDFSVNTSKQQHEDYLRRKEAEQAYETCVACNKRITL